MAGLPSDIKDIEQADGVDKAHKTYETYYEVEQLLDKYLPQCKENLKTYMNYVARKLLYLYAEDWSTLQLHCERDFWTCRIYSDDEDYRHLYKKMKLLNYTNFILPEQIPQDEMDYFIRYFNLA